MTTHDADATSSDFIYEYDVFLSFRGDTRHAFTDHLCGALRRNGIHTFRDVEGLRTGDHIRTALFRAIGRSRVYIAVLCQNYASSTWCLDELEEIMKCSGNGEKRKVVPIFYKVEPSEIRKQENRYGKAMSEHEERFRQDPDKVKAWRSALTAVCDLSGDHYNCRDDTYEDELVKKIVKDTSAKLPPMPLQIKGPIIGLDAHIKKVISLLKTKSKEVRMLGIYGAGGIGKTTFAVNLYNKIRDRFEAASFLHDVREKSNKSINGLQDLQKTLLSEMGEEVESMMIGSTFKGGFEIKRRLGHKKVLLVLDDVDDIEQLKSLAAGLEWFGPHSRIIITTRDTNVLDKHALVLGDKNAKIRKYKLKELNHSDSLELFCWYAFNMSVPEKDHEEISSHAISYAKGLPLALEVIGSNLKGRSVEEWDIELDNYKKVPDAKIQGVLEVSYNSLSELEQKIFLDIACFFKGEKWEYVKRILEACDFGPNIRLFVSKCLIAVDEYGYLEMHNLIQDMGREVVRKESRSNLSKRSRLWSHKEVLKVLKEDSGSSRIEGILLNPPTHEEVGYWTNTAFKKMKNLRILIIRNTRFSVGPTYLPNDLRLLDWNEYPSDTFPPYFAPERIVDFNLPHSRLMLKKPFQEFKDLASINLSYCQSIIEIPDVSGAKQLRVLQLDKCTKLVRIDESVGFLPNLAYLSASECCELESFVPKMYLPSLEMLSFNFCYKLESFPHIVGMMDKPLTIHMMGTAIKGFPHSIDNLTGLEYLDMSFCKRLEDLPTSLLLLPKLVTLKVERCSQLREFLKRFKNCHPLADGGPKLETLYFREANLSDEDLPVILQNLPNLEELNVSCNDFISISLPKSIERSCCLTSLDVSYCKHLQKISELPFSVQKVNASHCGSLTSEASNVLWSQVRKGMERIEVVMPKSKFPQWFNFVHEEGIPCFWARRKFPAVALAFEFGQLNEVGRSRMFHGVTTLDWQPVVLHLVVDGREICCQDYHPYFRVGEDHVLLCDLRFLLNDEEWESLDASLGDDWKAVQVVCKTDLIMYNWGVYVYEQEKKKKRRKGKDEIHEDIKFMPPNPNLLKANMSSLLTSTRTMLVLTDVIVVVMEELGRLFWSDESGFGRNYAAFLMNALVKMQWKASDYGTSLINQEIDQYQQFHDMPEQIAKLLSSHEAQQLMNQVREEIFEGKEAINTQTTTFILDIKLPIILEEFRSEAPNHRYLGDWKIKRSAPTWTVVRRKINQLTLGSLNKGLPMSDTIILLKCHCLSCSGESKEEEYHDPLFLEAMSQVEQYALETTSLNQAHMKLKASIALPEHYHFASDPFYQALFVITYGNMNCYMPKPHSYRKLRIEHSVLRKRYQVMEEYAASNFPSRKFQPVDELISMKHSCSMDEGSSLTKFKELGVVWKERDEELQRLYDAKIKGYKNSRDFEDLMGVVYLDGLSDGLLNAQVILMMLLYPYIHDILYKEEEHALTFGYGGTLEEEDNDQALQTLLVMRQGYLGSGVGLANDPGNYGLWKVKCDSVRKKLQEFHMKNSTPANFHCSTSTIQYDELLKKFYTVSAQLMSSKHQRNGLDTKYEHPLGSDDETVSMVATSNNSGMKWSAMRRTVVLVERREKRGKEVDSMSERLCSKLKNRAEELLGGYLFMIECLKNSQECFEDMMSATYFEGLKDGFLEA